MGGELEPNLLSQVLLILLLLVYYRILLPLRYHLLLPQRYLRILLLQRYLRLLLPMQRQMSKLIKRHQVVPNLRWAGCPQPS